MDTIPLARAALVIVLSSGAACVIQVEQPASDDDDDDADPDGPCDEEHPDRTVGLRLCTPEAEPGYTLFAPMLSDTTWLIDMRGNVVHSWVAGGEPASSAYLLDDGSLLRPGQNDFSQFGPAITGGKLERLDWDGQLSWRYELATATQMTHHDVAVLPNGNYLMLAVEKKSAAEAIAAGRDPGRLSPQNDIHPDFVFELDPSTREVVWEWHLWDHLIQSLDPTLPNYGAPSLHPELLDLNGATCSARATGRTSTRSPTTRSSTRSS